MIHRKVLSKILLFAIRPLIVSPYVTFLERYTFQEILRSYGEGGEGILFYAVENV